MPKKPGISKDLPSRGSRRRKGIDAGPLLPAHTAETTKCAQVGLDNG